MVMAAAAAAVDSRKVKLNQTMICHHIIFSVRFLMHTIVRVLPRSADCRLLMSVWLRTLMHVQLCNAYSTMVCGIVDCECILNVSELFSLRILYLFK